MALTLSHGRNAGFRRRLFRGVCVRIHLHGRAASNTARFVLGPLFTRRAFVVYAAGSVCAFPARDVRAFFGAD